MYFKNRSVIFGKGVILYGRRERGLANTAIALKNYL